VRTYAYIDGFNFYYGAVKNSPYKWLDFRALFTRILLPRYDLRAIKYFTAHVSAMPHDPQQPNRQRVFIRALKAYIPELTVILGQFRAHNARLPLVNPSGGQLFADVIKTEEKGSDVNIAVHLLNDAWHDLYDAALVVSNDSDLAEALRLVRDERNKEVILLTPPKFQRRRSAVLKNAASRCMTIKNTDLAASQLPNLIPQTNIYKPDSW
jgi:uncharacterized LabA/DUF88 family protein